MKRTKDGRIEVQFDVAKILKFISHISEASNVAAAIFHLSKQGNLNDIPPLETDGLPIAFQNEQGSSDVSAENISDWIFKKAFEDFIVGLMQSLIESYTLLKLKSLADNNKTTVYADEKELQKDLDGMVKKAHTLSFPALIDKIEEMIGDKLVLREEVLSINQVRNSFVHKNGIPLDQPLSLRYIQMQMFVRKDGNLMLLTKELKKERFIADQLLIQSVSAGFLYPVGSKIKMTPDVFKDVTYTCIQFIHELINKLPLPNDIKDQIISPFKINLVAAP